MTTANGRPLHVTHEFEVRRVTPDGDTELLARAAGSHHLVAASMHKMASELSPRRPRRPLSFLRRLFS